MTTPSRRAIALLLINITVFLVARLGLWLVYQDDFREIGSGDLILAFVRGEWFDLSVIAMVSGIPVLMLLLPFRWASHSVWSGLWIWMSYGLLVVVGLLLAADVIYFGFVHRHAGPEIAALGGDPQLLVDMAFGSYAWAVALYVACCVALFVLWRRLFHGKPPVAQRLAPRIAVFMVALVGVVFFARGGLGKKPIDVVDAFSDDSAATAYLKLNGPFAMGRAWLNAKPIRSDFLPWHDAVQVTRELVLGPNEQWSASDDYPLVRAQKIPGPGRKPNVVVMMLESWDAIHNDAIRRSLGLEPLGCTPNFDKLARQGRLFTHFYANGERSMDGLAALVAGIPTLPGTAYIGMGMEQNRMAFLGHMAAQEGYQTIFLQSSKRQSFHVDSIAAMAGFQTYLGAEDIPATGHSRNVTERGAWDHDMFQAANRRFADARKPFLGFVFTASTHLPFQSPGTQWQKFEPDSQEHKYLNSLCYADWALGQFFDSARRSGYFNNTIFVLTADHVSGYAGNAGDTPSMHHVPLLIVAPGLKPGVDKRTGGQVDVIPTLAALAGWRAPHAGLGHSLTAKAGQARAGTLTVRGNIIERIEDNGWVAHDLRHRVGESRGTSGDELKAIERRLLGMYQVAHALLLTNRIVPRDNRSEPISR